MSAAIFTLSTLRWIVGMAADAAGDGRDMPILGTVLLEVRGSTATATGGDGVVRVVSPAISLVEAGDLRVCLEARRLVSVLGSLAPADDRVSLSVDKNHRVKIRSGRSDFTLAGVNPVDYPPATKNEQLGPIVAVPALGLAGALRRVLPSVSMDENRYGLNGINFERVTAPDGAPLVRLVSTDGSRLTWAEVPGDVPDEGLRGARRALLSRRGALVLQHAIKSSGLGEDAVAALRFGDRRVEVKIGEGATVGVRLLEGEFPDYRLVIPPSYKVEVAVEVAALAEALGRVSLMASDRNSSIRAGFAEGRIALFSQDAKAGDVREEVSAEVDGAPMATGLNGRFVVDALKSSGAPMVRVRLGEPLDAVRFEALDRDGAVVPGWSAVVMPMRLD
jgi:DNA polymerase-3 subunit beta